MLVYNEGNIISVMVIILTLTLFASVLGRRLEQVLMEKEEALEEKEMLQVRFLPLVYLCACVYTNASYLYIHLYIGHNACTY